MDRIFQLNWYIDLPGMKYKCPSTSCRREYTLLAPLKTHFQKKHPSCGLVVTKRCRSCSLNLQDEDVNDHRRTHRTAHLYGSPQSSSSSPASVAASEHPEDSSDSSSTSPPPNHHVESSHPTSPPDSCLTPLVTSPPTPQLLSPLPNLAVPFTSPNPNHHSIMSPYPTSPPGSDLTPLVPSPPTPQLLSPSQSPTAPPGPISTVADCSCNDPTSSPCPRDDFTAAPPSSNRRLSPSSFFNHRGPLTPPPMNIVPHGFNGSDAEYFKSISAQLREVIARSPGSVSSSEDSSQRPVSPSQRPCCAADPPGDTIPASPSPDHPSPISSPINVGASTSCANVVPFIPNIPNIPDPPLCSDPPLVDPPPGDDLPIAPEDESNDPINIAPDRPVFPNEAIQAIIQTFRDEWLAVFQTDSSWDDFSASCDNFAQACLTTCLLITSSSSNRRPAPRRNDRPTARPARPAPDARFRQRFDAVEASRIQGLYRYSRKRAAHHVLRLESASYTGSRDDAQN